jgi:O-antigen/teichoic acid export membrane protein
MFAFIFSCLIAIILFIFFKNIQILLHFPLTHISWLYFLPLSAFLFSIYDVFNYWLIRKKAFKSSALNKISRRLVEGGVQAFFGFRHNIYGLFFGDIIGNLINVISAIFQVRRKNFTMSFVSRVNLTAVLKRYSHFPKYNLVPTLLNAASLALPLLFINKLFDPIQVGYIDLSRQVLAVPLALISITIGQVLLQRLAQKRNNNLSISQDLKVLFYGLGITAVLEIIIILFFGESLFGIVFGKSWAISGSYSKILVFSYSVKFIMTTLSIAFIALEKIKLIAIWQISYFCAISLLAFVGKITVVQFLGLYVAIELISYSAYFVLLVKTVGKYEKQIAGLKE